MGDLKDKRNNCHWDRQEQLPKLGLSRARCRALHFRGYESEMTQKPMSEWGSSEPTNAAHKLSAELIDVVKVCSNRFTLSEHVY